MSKYPKKQYTNIGTVRQSLKKDENDPNEPPKFYIKLEQQKKKDGTPFGEVMFPITCANGLVLNDGDSLTLFNKKDALDRLVKEKKMTRETADKMSFIKYDVCIGEDVNEGGSDTGGGDINF